MKDPVTGLTPVQQAFVQILPEVDFNASEAYRRSRKRKITNGTARVEGCRLLTYPNVRRYLMEEAAKNHITPGRVFQKLDHLIDYKRPLVTPLGPVMDPQNPEQILREDDPTIQLKAIEVAVKVLPQFDEAKNGQGGSTHLHKHLHLSSMPAEERSKLLLEQE